MTEELRLIHSFDRNDNESVQLFLKKYNQKYYIDLRIWFKESEGSLKPTRKGITFAAEHLVELKKGIDDLCNLREGIREKSRGPETPKQTFTGRREAAKIPAKSNPNSF